MDCEEKKKFIKTKKLIDTYLDSRTYDRLEKAKNEIKRGLQSDLNNGKLDEEEFSILMEYLDNKEEKDKIDFREEFRKSVLAKISEEDRKVFVENKRKQNEQDEKKEIDILLEKEKRQDLPRMARKSDAYNGTMINITPKEEKIESKGEER